MADDKILQHSHYKEEPVPRLEEARLTPNPPKEGLGDSP